jgi:spermidine/putrescine-binding protein
VIDKIKYVSEWRIIMKKKLMYAMILTLLVAIMLTGCKGKDKDSAQELNLFVWTEYVPDSVIKGFEEETGIKVNVSMYSSNEDMLSKVKSEADGTYDIVLPSDYMIEQMIAQDMFEPLDKQALTNLSNIGESYLDPSYDPGNIYTVPYQGGVGAIAVDTSKVTIPVDSYSDLTDPAFKNSLVVLDDYRAVIGMVARGMGYSMSETDPSILSEIEDKLLMLKDNVKLYDSDSPKSALISGDCSAGFIWSAEIALAMDENPNIKVVYPKEGAYLFMDNWAIMKGSKHYDSAMKFINYMLKTESAKLVLEEFPYLNPNTEAVASMGEEYINNQAKNPPAEVFENGEYIANLDTDTLTIYDEMWTKMKE